MTRVERAVRVRLSEGPFAAELTPTHLVGVHHMPNGVVHHGQAGPTGAALPAPLRGPWLSYGTSSAAGARGASWVLPSCRCAFAYAWQSTPQHPRQMTVAGSLSHRSHRNTGTGLDSLMGVVTLLQHAC